MEEKDFNSCVTAEIPSGQMTKIYELFEDEATPYAAMRVSRCRPRIKRVTIYCDAKDVAYFNRIVANENKTEI